MVKCSQIAAGTKNLLLVAGTDFRHSGFITQLQYEYCKVSRAVPNRASACAFTNTDED